MNWDAIGAVGQILGSLATFVTVGFLWVQVHRSETEARHAFDRSRADRSQQFLTMATDERLAGIHVKANKAVLGAKDPSPFFVAAREQLHLTDEEVYLLFLEQLARWNTYAYGILGLEEFPHTRAPVDAAVRSAWSEPLFRFWYEHNKGTLNADAVRYVDKVVAQTSAFAAYAFPSRS